MPRVDRRGIAREVFYLYRLAVNALREGDSACAQALGRHIYRVYQKYRLRGLVRIKSIVCKRCNMPLHPAYTLKVRLRSRGGRRFVVYTCRACGHSWRKVVGERA